MSRLPHLRTILAALAIHAVILSALFLNPWNAATEPQTAGAAGAQIKTVFLIMLENTSWAEIVSNTVSAPYINNTIIPKASRANQHFNYPAGGSPVRPSEPNYIWLEGGSIVYPELTFTSNEDPSPAHSTAVTDHLVSLLQRSGQTWKSYQEDISGTDCPLVPAGGVHGYKPKHNPMVFFRDVTDNNDPNSANCIAHIRPLPELFTDLTNNTVAQYNFITPNQCNAMHDDCTGNRIRQGDDWLKATIPLITQSLAYKNNGAIFITFDENTPGNTDQIGMMVLSNLAKGNGYSNNIRYDHSSTLLTMQRIFGVLPPLRNALTATDLSDLFLPGTFFVPITSTAITGPASTAASTSARYSVASNPVSATTPITYIWQATGQSPVTHTGRGVTDTIDFSWPTTGTKTLTVTASNAAGTFTTTKSVTVTAFSMFIAVPAANGPAASGPAPTATPTPTPTPQGPPTTPSEGWKTVSTPVGVALLSVSFADNATIWVAGTGGTVLKSTDSGQTFNPVDIGTNADLYGIKFFDGNVGIAAGSGGAVRWTSNGGATWNSGTSGVGNDLSAVTMVNATTGWICGGGGTILRTTDGGKTWTKQTSGFGGDLNSIFFIDANTGWTVGNQGIILATTNGGQTWNRQKEPGGDTDSLSGVYFQDKLNGFAGGDPSPKAGGGFQSNLWRTTNGGASWARVSLPIAGPAVTSMRGADSQRAWAAAEERFVLKSTDGGQTWTVEVPALQPPGEHYWLYGLDVRADGLGIAVGGNYPNNGSFTPLNGVIMRRGPGL